MKIRITEQDYHRILNVSPEQRVTLAIDENQVVHPEIVPIHHARATSLLRSNGDFFYTGKQCVESLEMMHDVELISEWDSSNLQADDYDPLEQTLEVI